MDDNEFINKRACELSSHDSVLFIYNLASGNNFAGQDITVGKPTSNPAGDGKTDVLITGTDYRGLSGVDPVKGISRLTYIRRDLAEIPIPTDGSFFDIFRGEPTFLGSVEEFKRRTSFNCSAEDFEELAFYPDEQGVRRLKARADSYRFIGSLPLGRPKRDDVNTAITLNIRASLTSWDGIFFNNIDRLKASLIITHRPDWYTRLTQGQSLISATDEIIVFILAHLARKNISAGCSATPIDGVNLYGIKVAYKGTLRANDTPPLDDLDRVIALTIAPVAGLWIGGEIRLYYNRNGVRTPSFEASRVLALNMAGPRMVDPVYNDLIQGIAVNRRFETISDQRTLTEILYSGPGFEYNAEIYGQLKVVYNGPNRPSDQLPIDVLTCRVMVLDFDSPVSAAVSGPLKILYRAN